ncbi:pilus assembly protein PilY [Aggregicoccus sp. 17bor-14]|uniref:PilC/PilY family type IV pilus protein n=1 Tax=Myxococcaceae TaxID=31 RepID=UPI00129C8838|nr:MULTISPECIES: PilC/PilY family type IV pilus protein [Myxococcaceae]MBF5042814.1 pilus assembly protein PilY [Simulacricoccus sp. 17bor-14]MRI88582.1 pilus assembly protein PilY [Aggregicoccus sp. 17bor-14]
MRLLRLPLALLLSLVLSPTASAGPGDAACCTQSTSRLDEMMNPVSAGDERFFTSPGGAPNVAIVLDNSTSMYEWPLTYEGSSNNCDSSLIHALGYDKNAVYEPEIRQLNSSSPNNRFFNEWFANDKVYQVALGQESDVNGMIGDYGTRDNQGSITVSDSTPPRGSRWTGATRADAISSACSGTSSSDTCQRCLRDEGYYIDRLTARSRMVGNFLNFFSPRYIMARRVVKQVVRDIRPVRMSFFDFGLDENQPSPRLRQAFNPPCNQSDPAANASNFDSNRQSIVNDLNTVKLRDYTPLAQTLYGVGRYFTDTSNANSLYPATVGSNWADVLKRTPRNVVVRNASTSGLDERGGQNISVCTACSFNAAIVLTDGEPTGALDSQMPSAVNSPQEVTCDGCPDSDFDDVARFLWTHDLRGDQAGDQKLATYTVAFALDPDSSGGKLLASAATAGGGLPLSAKSAPQLKQALLNIFEDINNRSTSFSSASFASLQSADVTASAVLPRMSPQRNQPWRGALYRFGQFNEFVEDQDKNGDGDKDDLFLTDSTGAVVREDSTGQFVRAPTPGNPSTPDATPYWEAGAKLRELGWAARKVYTVTDSNTDGLFSEQDAVIAFSTDNWATLKPYLGVAGTAFCPTAVDAGNFFRLLGRTTAEMAALVGVTDTSTQARRDELCVKALIQYVRGRDLADEDRDGSRDDSRPSILGDIFHSSPVEVGPPVEPTLCKLGVSNQCLYTLFEQELGVAATPLASYTAQPTCDGTSTVTRNAYDKYQWDQRRRDKLILVGSNGGMLHAFHDGDGAADCASGLVNYSGSSGREVWAFVPPDLLPRLQDLPRGHSFYVDGDVMVRDIWADQDGDGVKDADEFHTVALAAEGRGGTHYFALELKFDSNGDATAPGFRWLFPQPCSDEAARFGKTFLSLSPKPPPIGPVLLASEDVGQVRHGVRSQETWVAMLHGGWSPMNEKGRGLYMVDVWRGEVANRTDKDNLLWKWEYDDAADGERQVTRKYMTHSFAAPVAMVDYGGNDEVASDGFFDTGIVGDMAGQLWTLRFYAPGQRGSDGLVTNWSAARSFEQDRYAVNAAGAKSVKNVWPFFYLPSVALQVDNKALRAFVGTGNRYALLERKAGTCRFDDPASCSKYGCSSVSHDYQVQRAALNQTAASTAWGNATLGASSVEAASRTASFCGSASTDNVVAGFSLDGATSCPMASGPAQDFDFRQGLEVRCGQDAAGNYACRYTDLSQLNELGDTSVTPTAARLAELGRNRFYGVWVYGKRSDRIFDEGLIAQETGKKTVAQFDAARLTDRGDAAHPAELVDVTRTSCTSTSCSGNAGAETGLGWFLEYEDTAGAPTVASLEHKTAGGAALLGSCVLWSTVYPVTTTATCAAPANARSYGYQADFVTGQPNCALGFLRADATYDRRKGRDVLAPPPEPGTAIQVSRSGQVRYSVAFLEPGTTEATKFNVSSGGDLLQSIYELPVSRALHACRHEDPKNCYPAAP